jgi:hypothetical protein
VKAIRTADDGTQRLAFVGCIDRADPDGHTSSDEPSSIIGGTER